MMNARFVAKDAAYALVKIDAANERIEEAAEIIVHDLTSDDLTPDRSRHAVATEALTKIGERAVPVMIEAYQKGR